MWQVILHSCFLIHFLWRIYGVARIQHRKPVTWGSWYYYSARKTKDYWNFQFFWKWKLKLVIILFFLMIIVIGKKKIHKSFSVVYEPHRQFPIGSGSFFHRKRKPRWDNHTSDLFSFHVTTDGILLRDLPISHNTLHGSLKIASCPPKMHKCRWLPSGKPQVQRKPLGNSEEWFTNTELHLNGRVQW